MPWNQTLNYYLSTIYCVCPSCGECAVIRASKSNSEMPWHPSSARLYCSECSYVARWKSTPKRAVRFNPTLDVDPYFGHSLFLVTNCAGNFLFAFNPEHIQDLTSYIQSTQRPRPENTKWSMVNRLPKWMKLAPNRQAVLRGLNRLSEKAKNVKGA